MPHKSPADKRLYMRMYYRKNRAARKAHKKANARRAYERDPEAVRAKWRADRKACRSRAVLRELERIKAAKPTKSPLGYVGTLKPSGF